MNDKLIEFIENSFLKELLLDKNVTDISYNGRDIFYENNLKGRKKSNIKISQNDAYNFLRQIANLSESQFSYTSPILDVSVSRYRINATHYSISRKDELKTCNFSIRIISNELLFKEYNSIFERLDELINLFINTNNSIIIAGTTGSGKTEFQKYLISKFNKFTRLIVLDNVNELDQLCLGDDIDLSLWLINQNIPNLFQVLIKNALRSNPDYIVVSEARGEEMAYVLNSAMSGIPTITTIHAKNLNSIYERMARMVISTNKTLTYEDALIDIKEHFKILIYLKKKYDETKGEYVRYIDSLGCYLNKKFKILYSNEFKFNSLSLNEAKELNLDINKFKEYKARYEA